VIHRLASLLFAQRQVVVFSRGLDPSTGEQAPDGYTFTDLTARDFLRCALAAERGRLARFEQRLSDGYRCAGFRDAEGSVVSYIWIARGDAGPSSVAIWRDVRVSLQPHDVFFWDCRTDPAHVRRGLYRSGLRIAGTRLAVAGSRRAFIETDTDNAASRLGIVGAGFLPAEELTLIASAGLYWIRSETAGLRRIKGPLRLGDELATR
jgi:hypothetical protein